jgi:transposase
MPRVARLSLSERQRAVLEKWSRGGSTPYRLVVRSRIILLASQGYSDRRIARRLRINPITVARWRSRFLVLGTEGIRREAPRLGSPPRIPSELVRTIVKKTLHEQPSASARWSTRSLARSVGVSHSTVHRIWKAYDVRPPRSRGGDTTRISQLRPRSIDVIGLYVNPPQRALAFSLRKEVGGPTESPEPLAGRPAPRPEANRRSWMTSLLRTLTLLEDRSPKGSPVRYVDPEFLSFLQSVRTRRRGRERIMLLTDSASSRSSASLGRWLRRHPEFFLHLPDGKGPLREIVAEWLENGPPFPPSNATPGSLPGLRTAVERWVRETGVEPRPFAWTRE